MIRESRSALAEYPHPDDRDHVLMEKYSWKNPSTISTVSTALLAATLLLLTPELGIGGAIAGAAAGAVSAGIALTRPAMNRASSNRR